MKGKFHTIIFISFALFMTIVLSLLLFFSDCSYYCKKDFLLPNWCLLIIAFLFLFIIYLLFRKLRFEHFNIYIVSVVVFIFEIIIIKNIFFITGWDVKEVLDASNYIALNDIGSINVGYFSIYSNNLFLLSIYSHLFKLLYFFKITDLNIIVFVILVFQSILVSLSGIVLYKTIYDFSHDKKVSIFGYFCYAILILLSPWIVIPYSDMLGLVIPILIIRFYQISKNKTNNYLYIALIGLLSYIGYKIKPFILLILISIIVVELITNIKNIFHKSNIINISILSISIFIGSICCNLSIRSLPFNIDNERSFTPIHMIMMGLNSETNGVFSNDDVVFTDSLYGSPNKIEKQFEVINQRISDYGFSGMINHYKKKLLTLFNDGSFAWGNEGSFYDKVFENDSIISNVFKSFYYNQGANYNILLTIQQTVWLLVLFLCIVTIKCKIDNLISVVMLTIIEFIIFELIFEVRARYLIAFLPLFILLASLGFKEIILLLNNRLYKYID